MEVLQLNYLEITVLEGSLRGTEVIFAMEKKSDT
jgi:hypothetical protein